MGVALATELETGGSSVVSRRIGAKDKKGVDNAVVHTIIIMFLLAFLYSIPCLCFLRIFSVLSARDGLPRPLQHAHESCFPRLSLVSSLLLPMRFYAQKMIQNEQCLLWSLEGFLTSYQSYFQLRFSLGVPSAAWASVLSMSVSTLLLFYWLFLKTRYLCGIQLS